VFTGVRAGQNVIDMRSQQ